LEGLIWNIPKISLFVRLRTFVASDFLGCSKKLGRKAGMLFEKGMRPPRMAEGSITQEQLSRCRATNRHIKWQSHAFDLLTTSSHFSINTQHQSLNSSKNNIIIFSQPKSHQALPYF
jgi:hypothetical protein